MTNVRPYVAKWAASDECPIRMSPRDNKLLHDGTRLSCFAGVSSPNGPNDPHGQYRVCQTSKVSHPYHINFLAIYFIVIETLCRFRLRLLVKKLVG